jgi:exonuclease III
MTSTFRLVAWNIRAGGGVRAEKIGRALHEFAPSAIILSEYRSTPPSRDISSSLALTGCSYQSTSVNEVDNGQNALLIAATQPMRQVALRNRPSEPGRWRIVRLAQPKLVIAGVHVPNQHTGRKPQFHDSVLSLIRRWKGGPAIIAGDTNSGKIGEDEETSVFNQRTSAWFEKIHAAGWRDAFRLVHGGKREFTWYSPGHRNGFRLDQAFVSPELVTRVKDVRHEWPVDFDQPERRDALSDHAALIVDFDTTGLK